MFKAPIPGQSLTTTPKNTPYERPPKISDPDKAIAHHLAHLNEGDRLDSVMQLLEKGVDVQTMTEGLLRSAVANGLHSVDVSLIIGPVVHEYIKSTATRAGIPFKEGEAFEKKDQTVAQAEAGKQEAYRRIKKDMPKLEDIIEEPGAVDEVAPTEEEVPQDEAPKKGLMGRRT